LELRARLRNVLAINAMPDELRERFRERILLLLPDGFQQWVTELMALRPLYGRDASSIAFGRVLSGAGYDGLAIFEERASPAIGGTQLVIFDPRNVVVIDDG
jgi:hypothetical protein